MTMATRIVVMKDGLIQQVDTPQNLYDLPCNMFVAGLLATLAVAGLICGVVALNVTGFLAVVV